jgi:hypothetical protein
MSDFRGPLPLDDRDFAEVRRNVLGRIEKRSPLIPVTLAAAAVIALVILLIPRQPPASPRAVVRPRPAPVVVVVKTPPAPAPVKVAERPKPKRKPQQIASAGAPPPDSEITMNIETADPNVRIIWISR